MLGVNADMVLGVNEVWPVRSLLACLAGWRCSVKLKQCCERAGRGWGRRRESCRVCWTPALVTPSLTLQGFVVPLALLVPTPASLTLK